MTSSRTQTAIVKLMNTHREREQRQSFAAPPAPPTTLNNKNIDDHLEITTQQGSPILQK